MCCLPAPGFGKQLLKHTLQHQLHKERCECLEEKMPVGFAPQVVYRCSAACSWLHSFYQRSSLQMKKSCLNWHVCPCREHCQLSYGDFSFSISEYRLTVFYLTLEKKNHKALEEAGKFSCLWMSKFLSQRDLLPAEIFFFFFRMYYISPCLHLTN